MDGRTTIQVSRKTRNNLKKLAVTRNQNYQEIIAEMIELLLEMDTDKTVISIPKKLATKIKSHIRGTDFKNVSEYVTFMLRLLLYEKIGSEEHITENKIKKRLKSLGYI